MKKFFPLAFIMLISMNLLAQCPTGVAIKNITLPTCGNTDGKFTVTVEPAQTPALFESSIDGGVTWFQHTSGNASREYTARTAGLYNVQVRAIGTTSLCNNKQFVLRSNYQSSFTATPSSASGCNATNGSIVLGGVNPMDRVSWISAINPTFVLVSSLTANTIPNLKPGVYYVIIKNPSNDYCFSTKTVTVGNSGSACPPATLCENAKGPNKFPNGTFGSGTSLNGPELATGETTYGYSQVAPRSPDDGFYAIANTTDVNGAAAGSGIFDNAWVATTDHTGDVNGYMMIVNASFDQDVVTEKVVTGLCPNKTYQFSSFIKNIKPNTPPSNTFIEPNLTFLIDGVGLYNTGNVSGTDWVNVGFTFKSSGTSAKFSIRNNNPGGNGNDWVIDDIAVSICVPTIAMNPFITTCVNPATEITATVKDVSRLYSKYKWQVNKKDGNGFVDASPIVTATFDADDEYTAVVTPTPNPISEIQNGWSYQIIVGEEDEDFLNTDCSFINSRTLVIAQCGVVLPVKFVSVNASIDENQSGQVTWQIAQQINIHHFEVEKSVDGQNFTYLSTLLPTANSTHYVYHDKSLQSGINYYRIKVINTDGSISFSKITSVVLKGNTSVVRVFPNPVTDKVFVWVPNQFGIQKIVVTDVLGKQIIQKLVRNSVNIQDIETSHLSKGVYNLQIFDKNNGVTNHRFIKN